MPNPYYDHTTFPAPNSAGSSAAMRTELDLIEQGFDKLPTLSGNANKLIAVNGAETALEPVSGSVVLPGDLTVDGNVTLGNAGTDTLTIAASAVTWSNNPTHSGNHTFSGGVTLSGGTADQVLFLNGSKLVTSNSGLAYDGTYLTGTFKDTTFTLKDETDATKVAVFELSGITTGTTRTYTLPNVSASLATLGNISQTFTGAVSITGTSFGTGSTTTSITLGAATGNSTTQIASGASTNGTTKTLNIGINGLSGSTTAITIGSSTSGATNNITINGNPTFSAGTANGVTYLNGSKVLTSGSALTFDGTNLGVGGTPLSAAGYSFLRVNGSTGGAVEVTSNGTRVLQIQADSASSTTIQTIANGSNPPLIFGVNSTEQMRLTSTGLGIGTSSPTNRLSVVAANAKQNITSSTGTNEVVLFLQNTGGDLYIGRENSAGTYFSAPAYSANLFSGGAYPMLFWTNSTERMRLDSSGNLGLGVTPSAWGGYTALQVKDTVIGGVLGNNGLFGSNTYYNGSAFTYIASDTATLYRQLTGSHSWFTAPSGTAGNAISFTQAMTLTSGGDLLVGTTSPAVSGIDIVKSGGTSTYVRTSDGTYSMLSGVAPALGGGLVGTTSNHPVLFYTNNTERARITSGGNFLINNTFATASKLIVAGDGTSSAAYAGLFADSAGANLFALRNDGYIDTGTRALSPYNNTTGSAANMFVDSAGGLFRSTSSLRYKTDVQDATHGLAEVMQLRPVTYKGKNDGDKVFGGLIAEEVHAVGLTEFVAYNDADEPDALHYGNMVALLAKAIQEQQALITDLRARVAALEA
jgi:hypothetical protein